MGYLTAEGSENSEGDNVFVSLHDGVLEIDGARRSMERASPGSRVIVGEDGGVGYHNQNTHQLPDASPAPSGDWINSLETPSPQLHLAQRSSSPPKYLEASRVRTPPQGDVVPYQISETPSPRGATPRSEQYLMSSSPRRVRVVDPGREPNEEEYRTVSVYDAYMDGAYVAPEYSPRRGVSTERGGDPAPLNSTPPTTPQTVQYDGNQGDTMPQGRVEKSEPIAATVKAEKREARPRQVSAAGLNPLEVLPGFPAPSILVTQHASVSTVQGVGGGRSVEPVGNAANISPISSRLQVPKEGVPVVKQVSVVSASPSVRSSASRRSAGRASIPRTVDYDDDPYLEKMQAYSAFQRIMAGICCVSVAILALFLVIALTGNLS